jgi:hypothetical protein
MPRTASCLRHALAVPVLFYRFQIYPELPAALLLLFAFRKLVLDTLPSSLGYVLSILPLLVLLAPAALTRQPCSCGSPIASHGPAGERFLYVFTLRSRGSFVPAETDGGEDRRPLGTYVRVP